MSTPFPQYAVAPSISNDTVTLNDLPPELLLIIFKFVYLQTRLSVLGIWGWLPEDDKDGIAPPAEAEVQKQRNVSKPISPYHLNALLLFPHTLSSICSTWMNIVYNTPHLWSSVVIFSDRIRHTFAIRSRINKAKEYPLHIIVTRTTPHSFNDSTVDPYGLDCEHDGLSRILVGISPHLSRCASLLFDVQFTSSLPRIFTDLPPEALHLAKLSLRAKTSTGLAGLREQGSTINIKFNFPKLRCLELDGYNLVEIAKSTPPEQTLFQMSLNTVHCHASSVSLHVSRFRSTHPCSDAHDLNLIHVGDLSVWGLLPLLKGFTHIELDDVDFAPEPLNNQEEARMIEDIVLDGCRSVVLSGLGSDVLQTLLECTTYAQEVLISKCSMSDVAVFKPIWCNLHLRDIHTARPPLHIQLARWEGAELHVTKCPGFNDLVLYTLGLFIKPQRPAAENGKARFRAARRLEIEDCDGFSMKALREMVETRRDVVSKHPEVESDPAKLELVVTRPPEMSSEDRKWFVDRFGLGVLRE